MHDAPTADHRSSQQAPPQQPSLDSADRSPAAETSTVKADEIASAVREHLAGLGASADHGRGFEAEEVLASLYYDASTMSSLNALSAVCLR